MGGGRSTEEEEWFRAHPEFMPEDMKSKFVPGGGTFRPVGEPRMEHPVLRTEYPENSVTVEQLFGPITKKDKKVYDMEALKRLVELLNKDRERKPYGTPSNANIGF